MESKPDIIVRKNGVIMYSGDFFEFIASYGPDVIAVDGIEIEMYHEDVGVRVGTGREFTTSLLLFIQRHRV